MGELQEWVKGVLENFSDFQAINFGRQLVVSFWLLALVLGGQYYGRRMRNNIFGKKSKRNSIRMNVDVYGVCTYYILFMLLFILL